MAPTWYILRSKPNKEDFFWGQLVAHFIEVYYPHIRAKSANPHAHKDKPYLPGHLFIHVDLHENPPSFFDSLPGSRGLVMDGPQPLVVPDGLIDAVRRRVDQINSNGNEELPGLHAEADPATQECPLNWYEIILDGCLSGKVLVHHLYSLLHSGLLPVELPGVERL